MLAPIDTPLSDDRRSKLKDRFSKEWTRKVKHERKNSSQYAIDLHKIAKRHPSYTVPTEEWEYLETLKAKAEDSYEDPLKSRDPVRRSKRVLLLQQDPCESISLAVDDYGTDSVCYNHGRVRAFPYDQHKPKSESEKRFCRFAKRF